MVKEWILMFHRYLHFEGENWKSLFVRLSSRIFLIDHNPNSWRLDTRGWNELTPATGHGSKLGFSGIMHITWVRVKIRAIFSHGAVRRSKAMIFYDFNFFYSIWKWCINMDLFKWRSKILFFFRWKPPEIVKKFPFRYEFLYSKL